MTSREPHDLLNDIVTSARVARTYVAGMTFDDFAADLKTSDSVIHRLELIGEAAGKLPGSIASAIPGVPWSQFRGMRNVLAHQYRGVDLQRVWSVVHDDLPPPIAAIEEYRP